MRLNNLTIALSLTSLFLTSSLAQEAPEAEVTNLSGSVEVCLKGEEDYAQAQEGMTLQAGDKIRTGSSSTAEISFDKENQNIVRLDENTDIVMLLEESEKIELLNGQIFTSINQLPSGAVFEIRTPTAVTGARGTEFAVKVSKEATQVESFQDNPYVKQIESNGTVSKEETIVYNGHSTSVKQFQRPEPLVRISEDKRKRWEGLRKDIMQHAETAKFKRQERPKFNREEFINNTRERKAGNFKNNKQSQQGVLRSDEFGRKGNNLMKNELAGQNQKREPNKGANTPKPAEINRPATKQQEISVFKKQPAAAQPISKAPGASINKGQINKAPAAASSMKPAGATIKPAGGAVRRRN
jgi:hypothetical protein